MITLTGIGIADVTLDGLKPPMPRQWGRGAVERADLVSPVEKFGHEVGADESGTAGDEHAAKLGGQR